MWCNPKSAGTHYGDTEDLGLLGSRSGINMAAFPLPPTSLVPVPGTGGASEPGEPSLFFPVCAQVRGETHASGAGCAHW